MTEINESYGQEASRHVREVGIYQATLGGLCPVHACWERNGFEEDQFTSPGYPSCACGERIAGDRPAMRQALGLTFIGAREGIGIENRDLALQPVGGKGLHVRNDDRSG